MYLFTSAIMVRHKSSGVFHNKNASTYRWKSSTGEATSSALSSSVQKSITELYGITSGKGKAKENEKEQYKERMEIVEHYDNGNDGLEDGSTQDAILSDSEESESVSEESTTDAIENREPAGNDKYSFLLAQHARWEELYCFAIYSALHKGWLCRISSEYGKSCGKWSTEQVYRGI